VVRAIPLGTTILMRNFDKVIQRFEEHDPVFSSITRDKIDQLNMKCALETPKPGTYNPKNETFKILEEKPQLVKKERRGAFSKSIVGTPAGSGIPILPSANEESMKKLTSSMIIN
jgi:hypothetical protein